MPDMTPPTPEMGDSSIHDELPNDAHDRKAGPGATASESLPESIGDYRVLGRLGSGGFGVVYLAETPDRLGGRVAIKVLDDQYVDAARSEAFKREASFLKQFDHPGILRILDVGQSDEFPFFIVTPYLQGGTLADRIRQAIEGRQPWPSDRQAAQWIETVARALQYTHEKGIYHRDVKPANILLDRSGQPIVADFGLALLEVEVATSADSGRWAIRGTSGYMSPEQARGHSDLLDARSDIYSLGVVLYELLARRKPFQGSNAEVRRLTADKDVPAPPLRTRRVDVSEELERICLKAIDKDPAARFQTAYDLAEALARVIPTLPAPDSPADVPVVFRRLGAYTAEDAGFFQQLLPGGEHGLPATIQFWKDRLEPTGAKQTERRICVLYGQSGCGKSSFVQAGVLPNLAPHVLALYLPATPDGTETALRHELQTKCPDLPPELDLQPAIRYLRDDGGLPEGKTKVVIVLDQFEQWLHGRKDLKNTELVQALSECDGARVQGLVIVRHDYFALQTMNFFRAVGVKVEEDKNWQVVELLQPEDAKRILERFGRSLKKLGQSDDPAVLRQESDFLARTVEQLAEDDGVLCVRLALFVEIMRRKSWIPETLAAIGGTEGIGVKYLEQMFDLPHGPPHCTEHTGAVRQVLKALRPPKGKNIREWRQSLSELLARARTVDPRYGHDSAYFQQLIHVMQRDTPLITPVESGQNKSDAGSASERFYQLTHDHLLESIRQWLDNHLLKTKAGQAERLLMEREALWRAEPASKYLPTAFEYLYIRRHYRRRQWSAGELQMMRVAGRRHVRRFTITLLTLLLIGLGLYTWQARNNVEKLLVADLVGVPAQVEGLAFYRPVANVLLAAHLPAGEYRAGSRSYQRFVERVRRWYAPGEIDAGRRLKASLALLRTDSGQMQYLREQVLVAEPREVLLLIALLKKYGSPEEEQAFWWKELDLAVKGAAENPQEDAHRLLAAASALAAYNPASANWDQFSTIVAHELVATNPLHLDSWYKALQGASAHLVPALCQICVHAIGETERDLASKVLVEYAKESPIAQAKLDLIREGNPLGSYQLAIAPHDPGRWVPSIQDVADAMLESAVDERGSRVFENLFPLLIEHKNDAIALLTAELQRTIPSDWPDLRALPSPENPLPEPTDPIVKQIQESTDALAKRQARAAVALLRLGDSRSVWPLLKFPAAPADLRMTGAPSRRSYLIHYVDWLGVPADLLLSRLKSPGLTDDELHALILALGEMSGRLTPGQQQQFKAELIGKPNEGFLHPSSGVHGAARWALTRIWERKLNEAGHDRVKRQKLKEDLEDVLQLGDEFSNPTDRGWYRTVQGHTMVIIRDPPVFDMGTPQFEQGREADYENLHRRRIGRSFCIATHATTRRQFNAFWQDRHTQDYWPNQYSVADDAPINGVTWFEIAEYCDWLTDQENNQLGENEKLVRVYDPPNRKYNVGLVLKRGHLERTGYRIPTESEMEYACRAKTRTSFHFGESRALLSKYAWFRDNSDETGMTTVGRFKPNDLGLFDSHGNAFEWCFSRYLEYPKSGKHELELASNRLEYPDGESEEDYTSINNDHRRTLRGGSFVSGWAMLRSGSRGYSQPDFSKHTRYGFRLARTLP